MIHYINSILLCITFFLLLKTYKLHEGYINHIGDNISDIPGVPHDALCMILYAMGVDIDRMEYLGNKCKSPENKQNKDENSNICRA